MDYNEEYLREFKRDYSCSVGGKYNLQVQVKHLARLAEYYYEKYQKTDAWTDCLRAHTLYNSVSVRKPGHDGWRKKIFEVQQAYWKGSAVISYEEQQEITTDLLSKLHSIRHEVRNNIRETEKLSERFDIKTRTTVEDMSGLFVDSARKVSTFCTERMIKYVEEVIGKSVQVLGQKPPCAFTVIAIGSLARGEATPYSDLEYIFLIETKSPVTEDYFRKLAMTSYFLIGNLGETKLKYMAIQELDGWFDDIAKNGFKIDGLSAGAGNIPTGNGLDKNVYSFIATPKELCTAYEHVLDNPNEDSIRGDVSAMLSYMTAVYKHGKRNLLTSLKAYIKSCKLSQERVTANGNMLVNDMKKFDFTPDARLLDQAYTVDVKRQLYRFPSILLYDLAACHQAFGEDAWNTAERLLSEKKISEDFHKSLMFQLAVACFIRLSAYLYHDSQDDRISTAVRQATKTAKPRVTTKSPGDRWYMHSGLLLALTEWMVPIKGHISLTDANEIGALCRNYEVSDASLNQATLLRVVTLHYTGHTAQAFNLLDEHFGPIRNLGDRKILDWLGCHSSICTSDTVYMVASIFQDNLYFKEALELFTHLCAIDEKYKQNSVTVRIATCQRELGNLNTALQTLLCADASSSGYISLNIGRMYVDLRQCEKGEKHLLSALQYCYSEGCREVKYDYYGMQINDGQELKQHDLVQMAAEERLRVLQHPTPALLDCIEALAYMYWEKSAFDTAFKYYSKYQSMLQHLYGEDSLIPAAAHGFNVVGSSLGLRGEHQKAANYFTKSLKAYHNLYSEGVDHQGIALLYCNMGRNYLTMEDFVLAQHCFQLSLAMYKRIYGQNSARAELADVLNDSGRLMVVTGQYEAAEGFQRQALNMYNRICEADNTNSAVALFNLAITYRRMEDYNKSAEHLRLTLDMFKRIHGAGSDHAHIAMTVSSLGDNYKAMKEYSKAEEYYLLSLDMDKRRHGADSDHPNIALSLRDLGHNYLAMNEYNKAEAYYRLTLDMYTRIHGAGSDHAHIAASLTNLGNTFHTMKEYNKAEQFYRHALDMYKRIHGADSNHPNIAATLAKHNKAGEYYKLSQDITS